MGFLIVTTVKHSAANRYQFASPYVSVCYVHGFENLKSRAIVMRPLAGFSGTRADLLPWLG